MNRYLWDNFIFCVCVFQICFILDFVLNKRIKLKNELCIEVKMQTLQKDTIFKKKIVNYELNDCRPYHNIHVYRMFNNDKYITILSLDRTE